MRNTFSSLALSTLALSLVLSSSLTTASAQSSSSPSSPRRGGPASVHVAAQDQTPHLPGGRVSVLPILFIPRGAHAGDPAAHNATLAAHLELARAHYQSMLGTTFAVSPSPLSVVQGEQGDEHYQTSERAERIMRELFAWAQTDRYRANFVFLVLYASGERKISGGGIPFNGTSGTGGGYIELDLSSLTSDRPYPFQSSLVHELGHAFGLAHADCYGYDQMTSSSIMSYNPQHWSSGLSQSATPGGLGPEDRAVLALNQRVFPGLRYDSRAGDSRRGVDPARLQRCFQSAVSAAASPLVDLIGVGFELFYDGARVNGPDAALYSRQQAVESCRTSRSWYPAMQVECRYNGVPMRER